MGAGRSAKDRYLGMVEASGSIPDQSIENDLVILICKPAKNTHPKGNLLKKEIPFLFF